MKASEILFEKIKTEAKHPKTALALENIKKACDYLDNVDNDKRPKLPITIRDVGAFTEQLRGGPTAGSIRNKQHYVDYIKFRANEQDLPKELIEKATPRRTGDLAIDSEFHALEVQRRALCKEIRALKSALADAGNYDAKASIQGERRLILAAGAEVTVPAVSPMNPELLETLGKIVNQEVLASVGLALENGRIKCPERNSRVFLDKRDVERIQKAINWNHQTGAGENGVGDK